MLTLRNAKKTFSTYPLPHETYCKALGKCVCQSAIHNERVHLADGGTGIKQHQRRIPSSITFLAGETKPDLPDALKAVRAVKAALDRGDLREVKS